MNDTTNTCRASDDSERQGRMPAEPVRHKAQCREESGGGTNTEENRLCQKLLPDLVWLGEGEHHEREHNNKATYELTWQENNSSSPPNFQKKSFTNHLTSRYTRHHPNPLIP